MVYLEISPNELEISPNELEISSNHLEISAIHLEISTNTVYLQISPIELEISANGVGWSTEGQCTLMPSEHSGGAGLHVNAAKRSLSFISLFLSSPSIFRYADAALVLHHAASI